MGAFKWRELEAHYINLSHRRDRNQRMRGELRRVSLNAHRFEALRPADWKGPESQVARMRARTPGAIGCYHSQTTVMRKGLEAGRNVLILEDDVCFADDIHDRLQYVEDHLPAVAPDWDVFFLGATFHVNPAVWDKNLGRGLGRDVETTADPRILRCYAIWSTYAWVVNHDSIAKVQALFDEHVGASDGIDHLFIQLGPKLNQYCFVPGMAWQYDNRSDIGLDRGRPGITHFSHFQRLGPYTWQRRMRDFDPTTFNWAEARR